MHMHNRTLNPQPRDMIERLVCTLKNPKMEHFVLPIPRNILNLLNVTTQHKQLANFSHVNDDNMFMRKQQQRQRQNLRKNRQRNNELQPHLKKRRNAPVYTPQTGGALTNFDYADNALNVEESLMMSAPLLADYYEERRTFVAKTNAQLNEEANAVEIVTSNALEDLLLSNDTKFENATKTNNNNSTTAKPKKQTFGIKVRLMSLQPEALQCPSEYVDPTELPLSRDLMDARNSNNGTASAFKGLKCTTFMLAIATLALDINLRLA